MLPRLCTIIFVCLVRSLKKYIRFRTSCLLVRAIFPRGCYSVLYVFITFNVILSFSIYYYCARQRSLSYSETLQLTTVSLMSHVLLHVPYPIPGDLSAYTREGRLLWILSREYGAYSLLPLSLVRLGSDTTRWFVIAM